MCVASNFSTWFRVIGTTLEFGMLPRLGDYEKESMRQALDKPGNHRQAYWCLYDRS